jgi:hypothetical protein
MVGIVDQEKMTKVSIRGKTRGNPGQRRKIRFAVNVAIDDNKRIVPKELDGLPDAARSFQRAWRCGRPADADAESAPIAERRFKHLAEVGMIDDEIGNPCGGQTFDVPDDQRPATHGE